MNSLPRDKCFWNRGSWFLALRPYHILQQWKKSSLVKSCWPVMVGQMIAYLKSYFAKMSSNRNEYWSDPSKTVHFCLLPSFPPYSHLSVSPDWFNNSRPLVSSFFFTFRSPHISPPIPSLTLSLNKSSLLPPFPIVRIALHQEWERSGMRKRESQETPLDRYTVPCECLSLCVGSLRTLHCLTTSPPSLCPSHHLLLSLLPPTTLQAACQLNWLRPPS